MTLFIILAGIAGILAATIYVTWRSSPGEGGMKTRAIALAVLVGFSYATWSYFYPTSKLHAKITIDVETPEGLKTGSSVQEVIYSLEPCPVCNTAGPKLRRNVRGEAVAVDIGSRGVLFAILVGGANGQPSSDLITPETVMSIFAPEQNLARASAVRSLGRISGKAEIPRHQLPFLVRFTDIADPKTVEAVDPDYLAGKFGQGVKLVKATIEIVPSGWWPFSAFGHSGTPVTTGIEKRLPWLPDFYDKLLDGDRTHYAGAENRLANSLGSGSFKSTR